MIHKYKIGDIVWFDGNIFSPYDQDEPAWVEGEIIGVCYIGIILAYQVQYEDPWEGDINIAMIDENCLYPEQMNEEI